jgi:hypothetical protein
VTRRRGRATRRDTPSRASSGPARGDSRARSARAGGQRSTRVDRGAARHGPRARRGDGHRRLMDRGLVNDDGSARRCDGRNARGRHAHGWDGRRRHGQARHADARHAHARDADTRDADTRDADTRDADAGRRDRGDGDRGWCPGHRHRSSDGAHRGPESGAAKPRGECLYRGVQSSTPVRQHVQPPRSPVGHSPPANA